MDLIMRNVFSLRAFKQIGAHTHACIDSFFLTLTHGKMMFSHNQILKVMVLYSTRCLCQENMCFLYGVCRCIDLYRTYYRCISCSFPNNLTNVIIYHKTRFCFGRLGYSLLCSRFFFFYYHFFLLEKHTTILVTEIQFTFFLLFFLNMHMHTAQNSVIFWGAYHGGPIMSHYKIYIFYTG
jgi:hypothetical protein